jgi:galactose oxidase-like protein
VNVQGFVITGAMVLATGGVLGMVPSAVQASSATWTEQAPAVHPAALYGAAMAYDAATGNLVLFGGWSRNKIRPSDATWTWDGSTWTKQAPAVSPPARENAVMAYDAATGNVVLFGGETTRSHRLADTWTWDGSTWTEQSPAASPSPRFLAPMAYDAATGNVVLFGGLGGGGHRDLGDTWTWDGSTWTKHAPAASPAGRIGASMAYDAAAGNIVLFSGIGESGEFADTWTWDGSTWTKQAPAASPPGRYSAAMAYDAATSSVVLFGGSNMLGDTWTWNGTTWTKRTPANSPSPRDLAPMAYDAATGNVVLFGGTTLVGTKVENLHDTWTWG